MMLRRLKEQATALAEGGKKVVAGYVAEHELGPRLTGLVDMKDDLPVSLNELMLRIVDAVDGDERSGERIDVERVARRNERVALAVKAMPTAGVIAGYVADLYCDAVIVCGVVDGHGLPLTDEDVGAHLLTLWGAAPDLASAQAILGGNHQLLLEHAADKVQAGCDGSSKIAMVRMLWELRSAGLRVAGERNLKGFIWPKKLVLQRVAIVQCQLAQWYQDPFGRFDHRYWDGAWTEHVSLAGVPGLDPPVGGAGAVRAHARSDAESARRASSGDDRGLA